jgi:hypothetical protein
MYRSKAYFTIYTHSQDEKLYTVTPIDGSRTGSTFAFVLVAAHAQQPTNLYPHSQKNDQYNSYPKECKLPGIASMAS